MNSLIDNTIVIPVSAYGTRPSGIQAAKASISKYFLENRGLNLNEEDITIEKETLGRPICVLKNHPHVDTSSLSLSISHTESYAIADICDYGMVGVDVERVRALPERVLKHFLTTNEELWLRERECNKILSAITLWSLKESFLKATGMGLRTHPQKVEIIPQEDGQFKILGENVECQTETFDDHIITKVIIKY